VRHESGKQTRDDARKNTARINAGAINILREYASIEPRVLCALRKSNQRNYNDRNLRVRTARQTERERERRGEFCLIINIFSVEFLSLSLFLFDTSTLR